MVSCRLSIVIGRGLDLMCGLGRLRRLVWLLSMFTIRVRRIVTLSWVILLRLSMRVVCMLLRLILELLSRRVGWWR